jgi:hypothetical protein
VLDQHAIAGGTTGHSTAKITSQHGLIYASLGRGTAGGEAARTSRSRLSSGRRGDRLDEVADPLLVNGGGHVGLGATQRDRQEHSRRQHPDGDSLRAFPQYKRPTKQTTSHRRASGRAWTASASCGA